MRYPIPQYINCTNFSLGHRNSLAAITVEQETLYYSQAIKNPRWREAMTLSKLMRHGTFFTFLNTRKPLGVNGFVRSSITLMGV